MLPAIYPQVRLPIYAVLAFSLSVVDVALILAPTTPPPLAVQVFRWFNDPDLALRAVGARRRHLAAGPGGGRDSAVAGPGTGGGPGGPALARRRWTGWHRHYDPGPGGRRGRHLFRPGRGRCSGHGPVVYRPPLALSRTSCPAPGSLDNWVRQSDGLAWSAGTTLIVGLAAAVIALMLVLGCLENERRHGLTTTGRALWLLYIPLLVPQVGFPLRQPGPGGQRRLDGTWLALVWSHLLFVLALPVPGVVRSLTGRSTSAIRAQRALSRRLPEPGVLDASSCPCCCARCCSRSAIGFAVSVAQYLPTHVRRRRPFRRP